MRAAERETTLCRFGLLGPLEIRIGDRQVHLRAPKQRTLLAALLVSAGRTVTTGELVDHLWDGELPSNGRGALHVHMTRLRKSLGAPEADELIRTVPEGYRAVLPPGSSDLQRFDQALQEAVLARRRADLPAEAELLAAARSLWRGPALVDVPSEVLCRDAVPALRERFLQASERYFEVSLLLGRHARILPELRETALRNTYRERFWCQLMLALYRCDRQAEALAAYREAQGRLNDELGIGPGDSLVRTHQAVLTGSAALFDVAAGAPAAAPGSHESGGGAWHVLCQLPPDQALVGRDRLCDQVAAAAAPAGTLPAPPVVVLCGGPGTGKTALAVRTGHRLRHLFPEGQWYVRLREADGRAREPGAVLAQLLTASGADAVPRTLEEKASALRTRLADRRVLMILDDAADAEQVTPLLPGTSGCSVLITSYASLPALGTECGTRSFALDALSPAAALTMLETVLGGARVAAEPEAARQLAALCGRRPLALRIAATRLADRPDRPLSASVADLTGPDRLSRLAVGAGRRTAVRAAFEVPYQELGPAAAALFRLLPLIPGPDFSPSTARALAGLAPEDSDRHLDRLTALHLLSRSRRGRLSLPVLLRLYAAERSRIEDSAQERAAAYERLRGWCWATATSAAAARCPDPVRLGQEPDERGEVSPAVFENAAAATDWLDAERPTLLAMAEAAAVRGPHAAAWQLADVLRDYLWYRRHHEDALRFALAGHAAALRAGDRRAVAVMRTGLGLAEVGRGRAGRGRLQLQRALTGLREARDTRYRIMGLHGLGLAARLENRTTESVHFFHRALHLAVDTEAQYVVGPVRRSLASALHDLGSFDAAKTQLCLALRDDQRLGITHTRAEILGQQGLIAADLGNRAAARTLFTRAVVAAEEEPSGLRDRLTALVGLARLDVALANPARAVSRLEQPLAAADATLRMHALNALGEARLSEGEPVAAVGHHTRALRMAHALGQARGACEARTGLALAHAAVGDGRQAVRQALAAVRACEQAGLAVARARALHAAAVATRADGRHHDASDYARSALELSRALGLGPLETAPTPGSGAGPGNRAA
ncbi:AfsR/SARP family transcriptional regulator [Streptomyces olivaceus]|uniref:AfsR/SARP family transcriptional regulator n=1 Tax=Streptomyces olivaceus TaxID=47716 RepID=UPI003630D87F